MNTATNTMTATVTQLINAAFAEDSLVSDLCARIAALPHAEYNAWVASQKSEFGYQNVYAAMAEMLRYLDEDDFDADERVGDTGKNFGVSAWETSAGREFAFGRDLHNTHCTFGDLLTVADWFDADWLENAAA